MIDRTIWERWSSLQQEGEPNLVHQLIEVFLASSEGSVQEIEKSIAAKYAKGLAFHAHSLKSSAASLGANQLAELCLKLEKAGRDNQIDQAAESSARELRTEYEAVKRELVKELPAQRG